MKVITAREAAKLIPDGCVLASDGFLGIMVAEEIYTEIDKRIQEEGAPKGLTLFHISGQGDSATSFGLNHFSADGVVKRVIGGHWNIIPDLRDKISANKIEGFNFPQGTISHMIRDIAAKRPGTITRVGLKTFVDPRVEGGKANDLTKASPDQLVELIQIDGQEYLRYKPLHLDYGILRGTYADEKGNISFEKEAATLNATSLAQAVHNCGGKVIVQVERLAQAGSLDPKLVKIPGIYVDYVVVAQPQYSKQTPAEDFNPSYTGHLRVPMNAWEPMPMSTRKIIARRAAMELVPHAVLNLGIGMPEGVASIAAEEGLSEHLNLTVEAGPVGGIPAGGSSFGASSNPDAILDEGYQFDFYDGGGIDVAFLGLAQADRSGNINVSKFGPRVAGCGGFINITQNSKKVVFCGTFTAGGAKISVVNGKLVIEQEGNLRKFVEKVDQITFSGEYAQSINQPVLYITERAVFQLRPEGLTLTEIAPGVELQRDILDLMEFKPLVATDLKEMDSRIFRDEKMRLTL